MEIADIGFFTSEISSSKFLIHPASVHVVSKAISSDSVVLLEITVCFLEPYDIAAPPNINIYPVVDLTSKLSIIQLASL